MHNYIFMGPSVPSLKQEPLTTLLRHTEPHIFDCQVQIYSFKLYFIIQTQEEAAALRGGGLSVLLCATMRSLPSVHSSKDQTALCPKVNLVFSSSNQREYHIMAISVAGFGIRCLFDPLIRDPGWEKIQIRIRDEHPGSYF